MLWFVVLTFQECKSLFCNIVRTLCEFFMKRNFAWTRFGARLHNEWFQTSAGKFLSDCKLYIYWYVCFWNFYHHDTAVVIMFFFITLPKVNEWKAYLTNNHLHIISNRSQLNCHHASFQKPRWILELINFTL